MQKNLTRVAIKRFSKTLRHELLKAVRKCFDEYNEQGGAIVQMQDKNMLYFPRACIYAIYTDQPAATKCALTGSACPVCYTRQCDMACAKTQNLVYRWDGDMALKKRNYKRTIENKGTNKEQRQMGRTNSTQLGIDLYTSNAFVTKPDESHKWIFGPLPEKDSVWQSLPQVTLHGFDEGICQKLNFGMLEMAITEAQGRRNLDATKVSYLLRTAYINIVN